MLIELLGDNCFRCQQLAKNIRLAIGRAGFPSRFRHACDPQQLASYGLLSLPGLVIDGELKAAGQLLSVEQVVSLMAREPGEKTQNS